MIINRLNPIKPIVNKFKSWKSGRFGKDIQHLKLIGITGSTGKTITGHLIYHILSSVGYKVAFLSTAGIWFDGKRQTDFVVNVASSSEINKEIKSLSAQGAEMIIVETAATGIAQGNFMGMKFDSVVLTNIGGGDFAQDFKTDQDYAQTIFSLLHQVQDEGLAVLNGDDDAAHWVMDSSGTIKQNIYAAWVTKQAAEETSHSVKGTKFKFSGGFFESKAISSYYMEDLLMAIKLCTKYAGMDQIDSALNVYPGLAGREEVIKTNPFTVVVDYAYHPIIVDMLLSDIRTLTSEHSRVITVIGAAGKRGDSRKKVGIPAAKYSDLVLLTPQDPRGEDVTAINTRIAEFAESFGGVLIERFVDMQEFESSPRQSITDKIDRVAKNGDVPMIAFDAASPGGRYNAIEFAVELARPGDVIVVFGKGDDEIMDFGNTLFEWNDSRAVKDVLDQAATKEAVRKYQVAEATG